MKQEILPPQKRTGRPHTYTPEQGEVILHSIATTGYLKPALDKLGLRYDTIHDWAQTVPGFAEAIAGARVSASAVIFDRMLDVAEAPVEETPEGERRRATLISTYQWALRHLNPRVYSDKVQIAAHVTGAKQDDATAASQAAAHLDRIGQNEAVKALVDLASKQKEQS
jgi:hypothetical protein